jgi:hypothetical protein
MLCFFAADNTQQFVRPLSRNTSRQTNFKLQRIRPQPRQR